MPTHIILWYSTFTQIYTHWPDRNAVLASRQCLLHINWMFPGFRVHVWFFCTRMFPDFGIQWCFASRYSMTLLLCVVLHPDIPWLCYYVFALHPDIPWLWFNVLFYISIFRDFVTMYCFISGYSVTLLLCVVLYYGFSLLHIFSLVIQPWMSAYIRKTDGVYMYVFGLPHLGPKKQ